MQAVITDVSKQGVTQRHYMVSVNADMELGVEGMLATPWPARMVYLPPTISRLWISLVTIYWKAGVLGVCGVPVDTVCWQDLVAC